MKTLKTNLLPFIDTKYRRDILLELNNKDTLVVSSRIDEIINHAMTVRALADKKDGMEGKVPEKEGKEGKEGSEDKEACDGIGIEFVAIVGDPPDLVALNQVLRVKSSMLIESLIKGKQVI